MNTTARSIILALLSVISLIVTISKCQRRSAPQGWTPQLEMQVYNMFYEQSEKLGTDRKSREDYANCIVDKLKEMFPNGFSASGSEMTDSMQVRGMRMAMECAEVFERAENIWNTETKGMLRNKFATYDEIKLLPKEMKDEYLDCMVFKVTNKFPKGTTSGGPDSLKNVIERSRTECLKILVKKYGKDKMKAPKAR